MSRTKVRWTSIESLRNYVSRQQNVGARHRITLHLHGLPVSQIVTRRSLSQDLGIPVNEVSGRINELVKEGIVLNSEPVSCPVTGNTVHSIQFNHAYEGAQY